MQCVCVWRPPARDKNILSDLCHAAAHPLLVLRLFLLLSPIFFWLKSIQAVTPSCIHWRTLPYKSIKKLLSSPSLGYTVIYVIFQGNYILYVVHCDSGVGLLLMRKRWEVCQEMEWQVISPSAADQVPLSVELHSMCVLISLFLFSIFF